MDEGKICSGCMRSTDIRFNERVAYGMETLLGDQGFVCYSGPA